MTEGTLEVTIKAGALVSVEVEAEGDYETKLEGSKDFTVSQKASFSLEIELDVTNAYSTYTPFENAKDAK